CVTEVLNLTITPSSTNTTSATSCDSYTWSINGQTYTTSGTYTAVVGCVTEVLNLTITPSSTNTTSATSCDSYTWSVNGQTYTTSGTYTAMVGCVTEVLNLTITPSSTNTTTAASCDSYTWSVNGQTYTASGTYTAVVGCVTEILNLIITTPGTACDDNNAATTNDTWDASCTCVGTPMPNDCAGVPGGSALPGTSCDDGNAGTINDTWDASCTCVGTPLPSDCAGVPGGSALPGSSCDDGNAATTNDTWDASCTCVGTPPCTAPSNLSIVGDTVLCGDASAGLQAQVIGSSPMTFSWEGHGKITTNTIGDQATIAQPMTGIYSVTVVNGCGSANASIVLEVDPGPYADAGGDTTVCGEQVMLHATQTTAIGTWTGHALFAPHRHSPAPTVTVHQPGTYPFIWTVGDGQCFNRDTVWVTFLEVASTPTVSAGSDQQLELETQATLEGMASAGSTVTWSVISGQGEIGDPASPNTFISGLGIGDNVVLLTASIGACASATDTVIIHVADLFIPEGFSPNADGTNDRYEITGIQAYPEARLRVFDRWGNEVIDRRSYANDWNGHGDNGQPMPDGTYFYVLNLAADLTYNGYVIIKR
ncbi:MAG: gliding motility-associated C-terminal domain-containing protein, partial [Flavobacteriales bacterium]|nr:gliding motility-associated C-terminal domain-containing protein [Flavobacteriales bacterium]